MRTENTVNRVQRSWLAARERRVLIGIAERLPAWVTPDQLTALGLAGAILSGAGFALSLMSRHFLWLVVAGLIINWFGDSLDGSLARARRAERPKYGFFVDHSVDVLSQAVIFIGLGLSPHMRFSTACLLLMSYWIAALFTFIRAIATNIFQISYFGIGPTEIRIALMLYTLLLVAFGRLAIDTRIGPVSLIDAFAVVIFLVVFVSYVLMALAQARKLAAAEGVAIIEARVAAAE
jgi:phosphatidylglycerophosphate synthase